MVLRTHSCAGALRHLGACGSSVQAGIKPGFDHTRHTQTHPCIQRVVHQSRTPCPSTEACRCSCQLPPCNPGANRQCLWNSRVGQRADFDGMQCHDRHITEAHVGQIDGKDVFHVGRASSMRGRVPEERCTPGGQGGGGGGATSHLCRQGTLMPRCPRHHHPRNHTCRNRSTCHWKLHHLCR